MTLSLESQIEGLLFWKNESLSVKEISKMLEKEEGDVRSAVLNLKASLKDRGITLLQWENDVALGTSKELSNIIESLDKDELEKDVGKAGLETLSIVLYQGPISRAEIDYIRGVNSSSILRNLLVRGLIQKNLNQKDQKSFVYRPTLDLLSYLGMSDVSELPDFDNIRKDIENFKNNNLEEENGEKEN